VTKDSLASFKPEENMLEKYGHLDNTTSGSVSFHQLVLQYLVRVENRPFHGELDVKKMVRVAKSLMVQHQ
jgi:hypothetical protein